MDKTVKVSFRSFLSIHNLSKDAEIYFYFDVYRMKAFLIMVVSQSQAMGTKVLPVSKAPVGLLVPLALR